MDFSILDIVQFFMLGAGVGMFGTLVGIGGGIVLVPIFVMLYHWSPQHAIGTSLFCVMMNALSGTIAYVKQKKVYWHAAIRFGLATFPGAFLGSYVADYFTGDGFRITFGIVLMILALLTYFKPSKKADGAGFDPKTFIYNAPLGITLSFAVGFLSSILGIGGGIIHVPAMVFLLGFPAHVATATSQCVLGMSSAVGVISHGWLGNVLWDAGLAIGIGAAVGAQIGARVAQKTKSRTIMLILSILMFLVGVRMIAQAVM